MRKYIILAYNITDIGGEHQYCRNKLLEVSKMGYETTLFSGNKGAIYIQELQKYANNVCPELKYPPYCFTPKVVKRTIDFIVSRIGPVTNDSIIECLSIATSEWGELLARSLKIKSIAFILDEHNSVSRDEQDFLFFKHKRSELAAISKTTYINLFKNTQLISELEAKPIEAFCTNTLDNVEYRNHYKSDNNIVFGCIGRLEKGYVEPVLKQLKNYCSLYDKKEFVIVLIGGSNNKRYLKHLSGLFTSINNVRLIITGYIYPIPFDLVNQIDIGFGTAGGAEIVALQLHKPCISVDSYSGEPIGVLNYSTKETTYKTSSSLNSFPQLIDDIIQNNFYKDKETLGMKYIASDWSKEVQRQFETFVYSTQEQAYYDINRLKAETPKYIIYTIIGKVFGARVLQLVHRHFLNPIKKAFT